MGGGGCWGVVGGGGGGGGGGWGLLGVVLGVVGSGGGGGYVLFSPVGFSRESNTTGNVFSCSRGRIRKWRSILRARAQEKLPLPQVFRLPFEDLFRL